MNRSSILGFALGPVGSALLGLVSLPIVAWFYSPDDIGRIAMLQVVINFTTLFFSLGLDQAYVRNYHESADKRALLMTVLWPGLVLLLVASLLSLFVTGRISYLLYGIEEMLPGVLTIVCIVAAFLSRFLSLILRMQERGMAFSLGQLLPKLLFVVVILLSVALFDTHEFSQLLAAHVISMLAVAMLLGWSTRYEWYQCGMTSPGEKYQKEMLRFGVPLIFSGLAFWGLTAADRIFLRQLSTLSELGIYSLAASFAGVAVIVQSIFSVVWAPTVYKWVAADDDLEKVDRVTEYVLSAVIFLFILAGLFSWVVSLILPAGYQTVQYVFLGCMAYPLFFTLSETTVVGLGVAKRSGLALAAALIALVVGVVTNYVLVVRFGAAGAAAATAVAFWVFLVCRTEFSCYVWRPLPRMKLYSSTFLVLILVLLHTLFGHQFSDVITYVWLFALLVAIFAFRSSLYGAVRFLNEVLNKRAS